MRTSVFNQWVCSALVLTALAAAGCSGSKSTPPATGTLTGKAIYAGETDSSGIAISLDGPAHQSAVTAADGTYTFTALPAGSYAVLMTPTAAQERPQLRTATVSATPGSTVPNVVFTPIGSLSGTATFGAATGNAGILVVSPGSSSIAVTDDAGNFTLRGLVAGTCDVIASAPGYSSAVDHAVAVVHNATQPAPALTLQPGSAGSGSITGQVILAGMAPQAGIPVTLQGTSASAAVLTDASGNIQFTGLPDGQYALTAIVHDALRVSETLAVQVLGGQQLSSPQFHFTPTGLISGSATLQGATTGNAGITATALGSASVTVTNDSGAYLLEQVPVGSFDVVASYPDRASATTATAVQVTWGQTTTAPALSLGPAVDAIGTVQGTAQFIAGPSGTPIDSSGIVVTLSGPISGVMLTPSSGAYSFSNLVAGSYTLTASASSTAEGQQTQSFTIASDAPFVAGENFNFTQVGSASGKVATTDGTAVAGALVVAQGSSQSAVSDASGKFLLSGLGANQPAMLSASAAGSSSTPVSVTIAYGQTTAAGTLTLSNAVQANVAIAGKLSLYGGPFGSTPDASTISAEWNGVQAGTTDADSAGNWSADLPIGFYSLSFTDSSGVRAGSIPSTVVLPGGGFVAQEQLYPLTTPYELEYGKQVVGGESVSSILTNPSYLGDAIFTISGGAVHPGVDSPQAAGTLALYHNGAVTMVPGAVPDLGNTVISTALRSLSSAALPSMQLGPQDTAVYLQGGMAYLARPNGSIETLGVQMAGSTLNGVDQVSGTIGDLTLAENVAMGGNIIALIGSVQGVGGCASDPIDGTSLYPVYSVDVSQAPATVRQVGCANSNTDQDALYVSPDGAGVWIEWTLSQEEAADTIVSSRCDMNENNGCHFESLANSYGLDNGVNPTFSSDGTAAVVTSSEGIWLISSDGTSVLQLSSGGDDYFNVYPAALIGTASDLLQLSLYEVMSDEGTAVGAIVLMPFRAGLSAPAPVMSTSVEPGIQMMPWALSNLTTQFNRQGVLAAPNISWQAASHLVFGLGDGSDGLGSLEAISFAQAFSGASPTVISTTAHYNGMSGNTLAPQLETIGGNDYLIYLNSVLDQNQDTAAAIEDYSFAAQTSQTIASNAGITGLLIQPAHTLLNSYRDSSEWIGWQQKDSTNDCYAAKIDVASPAPILLGACNGNSVVFSADSSTAAFGGLVNQEKTVELISLTAATPLAVPVALDSFPETLLSASSFLSDDSIVVSAYSADGNSRATLIAKLDASAPNGLATTLIQDPNYDTSNLSAGVAVAPNGGGMLAIQSNIEDSTVSGYLSADVAVLAANAAGATDLGNSLSRQSTLTPFLQRAKAQATPTLQPNDTLPGELAVSALGRFLRGAMLQDGTLLFGMRASAQDVGNADTGIGSLEVATTNGWAVHMLSQASASYAIVPGTMEVLAVQQRTAAPYGFSDGVYRLDAPSGALARQVRPGRR